MKNVSPAAATLTMLVLATGCRDARDERLAALAQQSLAAQSQQNERLAKQTEQIALASRRLVEGDSKAREDLLEAQKQLTSELHKERASLDRQHEDLEQERRRLATARHRDPIIAEAIDAVGLTLACLLPLLLAAYVIHTLRETGTENATLNELLVLEIAAEEPSLLAVPGRNNAALEHQDDAPHEQRRLEEN